MLRSMPSSSSSSPGPPPCDNSEKVHISSLSLLKMLKHGRAGVPMEVMGLMLGAFVDEYTIICKDVFAMPQSGTGVSVEAVDPVFQTKMLDMLKQTGRPEMVVGWYHSHPGFGCWLSGVDINTQSSFEALNPRAVAVVIDPIQSVKGKVVIDCFRLINPQMMMMGVEPRITTSNLGHLNKPSIQALIHGLNRHYYSIVIDWRKNSLEEQMLSKLGRTGWTTSLGHADMNVVKGETVGKMGKIVGLSERYADVTHKQATEGRKDKRQEIVDMAGKVDYKTHLGREVKECIERNVMVCLGVMLDTVVF